MVSEWEEILLYPIPYNVQLLCVYGKWNLIIFTISYGVSPAYPRRLQSIREGPALSGLFTTTTTRLHGLSEPDRSSSAFRGNVSGRTLREYQTDILWCDFGIFFNTPYSKLCSPHACVHGRHVFFNARLSFGF